jgi:hypothetical protein
MSIQQGNPGIVTKDLQLYYNREWSKSFKGEATTNLLRRTTTFDAIFWDGYCGPRTTNVTSNTTDVVDPFGKYNAVKVVRNGNNTCDGGGRVAMGLLYAGPTFLIAGQTYTMSFYARSAIAGTLLRGGLNDSHTFGYITLTTSWVRYSFTFTNISNTSRGFQFISDQATAGETYYIAAPQVEQKSYATLYCDITEDINIRNVTTTNLLTSTYSSLPTNWSVDGSGQGTIGTYSYIENNSAIRIVDVNSNTRFRPIEVYLSGFSGSTTYTFSIKYRKVSGTPTLRFQIPWYNSSNVLISYEFPTTSQINIYDIDGWQLAQYTLTSPVNAAKVTFWVQDGDDYTTYNHTYDLKEPQIQTGTVPTAWTSNTATANTLTSGGGLLDISGNNVNADLTTVGFDSSGFKFDGSSQFINLGTLRTSLNISADLTIEAVIKLTSNFTLNPTIVGNGYWQEIYPYKLQFEYNSNNGNLGLFRYDGTNYRYASWNFGNQNTFFLNKYAYVTATYNSMTNSFAIYYNGISQSITQSNPGTISVNNTTNFAIGVQIKTDGTKGDYFPGEINIVRVYNRALSSDEVLQNFNATRKTYGL